VRSKTGVIITGVLQNGPAAQAGVRPGDVIVSVAGQPVKNVTELLSAVAALQPGAASKLGVERREGSLEIQVTPGKRQQAKRLR